MTNKTERKIIHSLNELPAAQRKKLTWGAMGIGLLLALIYFVLLYLLDAYPDNKSSLFECSIDWILEIASGLALSAMSARCWIQFQLIESGVLLAPRQPLREGNLSSHELFSQYESPSYPSSSAHEVSMSINPGSGLPMSGSSLMDAKGNPYGTSSW